MLPHKQKQKEEEGKKEAPALPKKPWKMNLDTLEEGEEITPVHAARAFFEILVPDLVKSFPIRIILNCNKKSRRATEKFEHIDFDVSNAPVVVASIAEEQQAANWKGKGKATAADRRHISNDSEPETELEPEAGLERLGYIDLYGECFECQWREREKKRRGLATQDSTAHPANTTSPTPSGPDDTASSTPTDYHSFPNPSGSSSVAPSPGLPSPGTPPPGTPPLRTSSAGLLYRFRRSIAESSKKVLDGIWSLVTRRCCYWQRNQE